MTPELQDAYKLAEQEAVKICAIPAPKHPLGQALQIFARALMLVANDAKRALPVIEAARNVVVGDPTTGEVTFQPDREAGVAEELMGALVDYDEPQMTVTPPGPKPDLMAPLITEITNKA